MDNTSQAADEKQLSRFRNNFLQNIIDLINSKLCILDLSAASTRERHLRERTFGFCDGYNRRRGREIDQILNFFFPSFRDKHDRTRQQRSRGRITKLSSNGAHTLLSCLACFVLLAFARFTVNTDITHQRLRGGAHTMGVRAVDAFVSRNHRGSIETGFDRYEPRFHGIMSIGPRDFICFQDLFRKSRFGQCVICIYTYIAQARYVASIVESSVLILDEIRDFRRYLRLERLTRYRLSIDLKREENGVVKFLLTLSLVFFLSFLKRKGF